MTTITIHPSELALTFSFSETTTLVGWGSEPFAPSGDTDAALSKFFEEGKRRLTEAGRLTGTEEEGLNFTDEISSAVLALVDPNIVFLAERKVDDGLRRLTVHMSDTTVLGMTRNTDGTFEMSFYENPTAALVACAGFLGMSLSPTKAGARLEADQEILAKIHGLAKSGQSDPAATSLVDLGSSPEDAKSIIAAMADPVAAGVLSVLYCADNVAYVAEPFSVMTNSVDDTWIIFPPASLESPMVLEQSSVSALTARILVNIAAKQQAAA